MYPVYLDPFQSLLILGTKDAFLILTIGWHQPIRLGSSQAPGRSASQQGCQKGLGGREQARVRWGKEQLRESRCLCLCEPVCVCLCAQLGLGGGLYKHYESVCACV